MIVGGINERVPEFESGNGICKSVVEPILFVEGLFGNFDVFVDFVVNIASRFLDFEKRISFFVILLFSEFSVIALTCAGCHG